MSIWSSRDDWESSFSKKKDITCQTNWLIQDSQIQVQCYIDKQPGYFYENWFHLPGNVGEELFDNLEGGATSDWFVKH